MFPQGDSICKVFWFSRLIFDYFCGVDPLTAICGSPPGENRAIELRELGQSGDLLLLLLEGESVLTFNSQICQKKRYINICSARIPKLRSSGDLLLVLLE